MFSHLSKKAPFCFEDTRRKPRVRIYSSYLQRLVQIPQILELGSAKYLTEKRELSMPNYENRADLINLPCHPSRKRLFV